MQISQLNGNPLVMGGEALLDTYYPVGRIYFSTTNVSPASFMGGSWTRIQDRFLLCAGTTYAAGTTGGEANVTLTVDQTPSHTHEAVGYNEDNPASSGDFLVLGRRTSDSPNVYLQNAINPTGGGQPHNNMPPYLAVYAWRRAA